MREPSYLDRNGGLAVQNAAIDVVEKINQIGTKHYGTAHRLGSRELDLIAEFAQSMADAREGYIASVMEKAGVDFADAMAMGKAAWRPR